MLLMTLFMAQVQRLLAEVKIYIYLINTEYNFIILNIIILLFLKYWLIAPRANDRTQLNY